MKKILVIIVISFLFSISQVIAKICVSDEEIFDMGLISYLEVATKVNNICAQNVESYDYEVFFNFLIKYKNINNNSDENLDLFFKKNYGSDSKFQKNKFLLTVVNYYEENVINKSNLNNLCKGFVKELTELSEGGEIKLKEGINSFTDKVKLPESFSRCDSSKIFKPVWEQVDTLVCDEKVSVKYTKNRKEEVVDIKSVNKLINVFVFDFKNNKVHNIDADTISGKKKYTYSIYTDFKLRGDIIHKDQTFDNPNIRMVNDYIIGKTGNRIYFFNISYKDDHWIMLASTSSFNPTTTDENFKGYTEKYYCRSENGFIEEHNLNSLF